MSISLSNYVNINSQVGAGTVVPTRLLIGRFFTANPVLPTGSFLQFSNFVDVGTYFGTSSEEYYRALFYFSWFSKNLTSAPAIQFANWANVAIAPQIYPIPNQTQNLTVWQSISAGSFGLTIGGVVQTYSSLNFSTLSFAAIATLLTTTINSAVTTSQTGTLNATTAVTSLSSTSGLSVGMIVQGAGIPAGTTISVIDSSTAITLSQAATVSTSETLTFFLASNAQFANAVVTYIPSDNGFYFQGGVAGAGDISVQAGTTGIDITAVNLLGWLPASGYLNNIYNSGIYNSNAIWSNGSAAVDIAVNLTASNGASNNFGSFAFLNNLGVTITQIKEAAAWNAALNDTYLYSVPVVAANVNSWVPQLSSFEGLAVTLSQTAIVQSGTVASASNVISGLSGATQVLQIGMPVSGANILPNTVILSITNDNTVVISTNASGSATESITFSTIQFPEQAPMMIEAATNYAGVNTVQNYMFQVFDPWLTPLVTSDSVSESYDSVSLNYYGQTQTAGQMFNFYQRGLLQGPSSAALDMNTYVNEIWLKDAIGAALLQLLLNMLEVPANSQGNALALLTIQGIINQALLNGTISINKTLTDAQKTFITSITGDSNASYQVQNAGYWVDCIIQPIPDVSPVQYEAVYTLVYSKNDVIRLIEGSDFLI